VEFSTPIGLVQVMSLIQLTEATIYRKR